MVILAQGASIKLTAALGIGLMVLWAAVPTAPAQMQVPPPTPAGTLLSDADLDQLVGPVALYPDPLIAQILPASTQPTEIVMADRCLASGYDLSQIDQQPWDDSVKALARFPDVLKMMDDNLPWTTELGQAFVNQPSDVMDAIQRLRAQAQALGNLESTPQEQVVDDDGDIDIVPAEPDVIYVPVYQPSVIFAQRSPRHGFFLSFGRRVAIGAWFNHDCDWHNHDVIVWDRDRPRPPDWWHQSPGQRSRPVVAAGPGHDNVRTQPARVWHPATRPVATVSDRVDRGWAVPETHAATPTVIRPAPAESRRSPLPTERPASGALIGVESARETRAFSSRGEQSRQGMARSAPATHSPAPARAEGHGDSGARKQ